MTFDFSGEPGKQRLLPNPDPLTFVSATCNRLSRWRRTPSDGSWPQSEMSVSLPLLLSFSFPLAQLPYPTHISYISRSQLRVFCSAVSEELKWNSGRLPWVPLLLGLFHCQVVPHCVFEKSLRVKAFCGSFGMRKFLAPKNVCALPTSRGVCGQSSRLYWRGVH